MVFLFHQVGPENRYCYINNRLGFRLKGALFPRGGEQSRDQNHSSGRVGFKLQILNSSFLSKGIHNLLVYLLIRLQPKIVSGVVMISAETEHSCALSSTRQRVFTKRAQSTKHSALSSLLALAKVAVLLKTTPCSGPVFMLYHMLRTQY